MAPYRSAAFGSAFFGLPGSSCCAAKMMFDAGNGIPRIICARLPYGLPVGPEGAGAAGGGAGAEVQAANNRDDASRAQALFIDVSSGSAARERLPPPHLVGRGFHLRQ